MPMTLEHKHDEKKAIEDAVDAILWHHCMDGCTDYNETDLEQACRGCKYNEAIKALNRIRVEDNEE